MVEGEFFFRVGSGLRGGLRGASSLAACWHPFPFVVVLCRAELLLGSDLLDGDVV